MPRAWCWSTTPTRAARPAWTGPWNYSCARTWNSRSPGCRPGLDPCDLLVARGPEPFKAALADAADALDFKLDQILQQSAGGVEGGRRAVEAVLGVLALVPGSGRAGRRGEARSGPQPHRPAVRADGRDAAGPVWTKCGGRHATARTWRAGSASGLRLTSQGRVGPGRRARARTAGSAVGRPDAGPGREKPKWPPTTWRIPG